MNEQSIPASDTPAAPTACATASWRQSRYGFAAFFALCLVGVWLALRLTLYLCFKPKGVPFGDVLSAFLVGSWRDVFVALAYVLPLTFWFLILPNRVFGWAG